MNQIQFAEDKKRDTIAIGRIGVDLNANEIHRPMEETETFTKYVGGSPANITIGLNRLGRDTGFIGRVSQDQLGNYILNYFKEEGIDTSNIVIDDTGAMTGLAFTEIKSPEDCSILMYRDNVADLKIDPEDINEDYIKDSKLLIVSGTALAQSPSREAVLLTIEYARRHNTVVLFDLDYRAYSWNSRVETAIYYNLVAEMSDIIIGSLSEYEVMSDYIFTGEPSEAIKRWFDYQADIIILKEGKKGSTAYTSNGEEYSVQPFPADVVKTFGGGDAYASAFIHGLLSNWDLERSLKYASASAAIVVSSHSCSEAMPTQEEITDYIQKYEN